MDRRIRAAFTVLALGAAASASASGPTNLGSFAVSNPGFLTLGPTTNGGPTSLLITEFTGNPFAKDGVSYVSDVGSAVKSPSSISPKLLTNNVTWPNEGNIVPQGAVPSFEGYTIPFGFLVPGKSNGGVALLTPDGDMTEVSPSKSGWFYHRALWFDMNNDGRMDIVAARATKPIFGSPGGELLWLEQPATDPLDQSNLPWTAHTIASGKNSPDVFFRIDDLDGDGSFEILYASYFTGGGFGFLQAKDWTDPTSVTNTMVDSTPGPMFDIELVDLNGDGRKDVLATNNGAKADFQSVYAYEVPADLSSEWHRHTLASGFTPKGFGPGKGAPGAAKTFFPDSHSPAKKPMIALSGDDDQNAYLLTANSTQPGEWGYDLTTIMNCGSTVGELAVGDADGDGFTEIFVPCYGKNAVHVFTFAS